MPSFTVPSSLLEMTRVFREMKPPVPDAPWSFIVWQKHTGFTRAPWAEDWPDDEKHPFKWDKTARAQVKAFVDAFCSMPLASKRQEFTKTRMTDTHATGRATWTVAIRAGLKAWKINAIVGKVLKENERDRASLLRRHGERTLPDMGAAMLDDTRQELAEALWGTDICTKQSNYTIMHTSVIGVANIILAAAWNTMSKAVNKDVKDLEEIKAKVKMSFGELDAGEVTAAKLKQYLRDSSKLMRLYKMFGDEAAEKELEEQRERLSQIRACLGVDEEGKSTGTMSKALREALLRLAGDHDIAEVERELEVQLDVLDGEGAGVPMMNVDESVVIEWESGTEDYQGWSERDVRNALGLEEEGFPSFNEFIDENGVKTPWTDAAWFARPYVEGENDGRVKLSPKWHQLIGIFKMLKNAFEGHPLMLMDEVGLGKTLQVIGVMAMLAHYRSFYAKHNEYPGWFRGKTFAGNAEIPDLGHVLVVPFSLRAQVENECQRYLRRGAFDIFIYDGTLKGRPEFWMKFWDFSKLPQIRRLVIATATAVSSDGRELGFSGKQPMGPINIVGANPAALIFTKRFLVGAWDEIHQNRNIKTAFFAAKKLRECCTFYIGMSATPVQTKPQDLWHVALILGVPGFDGETEYKDMGREVNRAARKDRQQRRLAEALEAVKKFSHGEDGQGQSELALVSGKWIMVMRKRFAGMVVRRTIHSEDNNKKPIIGLPPYEHHKLLLVLPADEMEKVEAIMEGVQKEVENGKSLRAYGEQFYLALRRGLTHPDLPSMGNTLKFSTIEEFNENPSTKLRFLVRILQWHLEVDNRLPLLVNEHGELVDPQGPPGVCVNGLPDKIIVYSAFIENNTVISQLFDAFGIKHLMINGSQALTTRTDTINKFRSGERDDSRVMLITKVGATGLNMAFANILVCLDTMWSQQEDNQLIGRVWRQPQPKTVHVYRLIAQGTPDVFLNEIAFTKGMMLESFSSASEKMKEWFDPLRDDDISDFHKDGDDDTDISSTTSGSVVTVTEKSSTLVPRGGSLAPPPSAASAPARVAQSVPPSTRPAPRPRRRRQPKPVAAAEPSSAALEPDVSARRTPAPPLSQTTSLEPETTTGPSSVSPIFDELTLDSDAHASHTPAGASGASEPGPSPSPEPESEPPRSSKDTAEDVSGDRMEMDVDLTGGAFDDEEMNQETSGYEQDAEGDSDEDSSEKEEEEEQEMDVDPPVPSLPPSSALPELTPSVASSRAVTPEPTDKALGKRPAPNSPPVASSSKRTRQQPQPPRRMLPPRQTKFRTVNYALDNLPSSDDNGGTTTHRKKGDDDEYRESSEEDISVPKKGLSISGKGVGGGRPKH
ncbi:unnamed protein product [Somion occarium]|uniref:Uncharacterized protein n=1 Tax=Somion occarium TaxID=3059160 RepID=A0ABP1CSL6_9APHY